MLKAFISNLLDLHKEQEKLAKIAIFFVSIELISCP